MRKFVFLTVAALMLLMVPVLADDNEPDNNTPQPVVHDPLASEPMECMMPPLPTPFMNNVSSPIDSIKFSATTVADFVEDSSIYAGCMTNKIVYAVRLAYWKISLAIKNKWERIREKQEQRFDQIHDQ